MNDALPGSEIVDLLTTPTEGDDVFELAPGSLNAIIDGGGGTDTVQLVPATQTPNSWYFGIPGSLVNIERVLGTNDDDDVGMTFDVLQSIDTFDGGGGINRLEIDVAHSPDTLDLTGVEIVNTEIRFQQLLDDRALSLKLRDKATALSVYANPTKNITIDFSGTAVEFTLAERNQIFAHGVKTVMDATGTYTYTPPVLFNFNEADLYLTPGSQPVLIDAAQDAVVSGLIPGPAKLEVLAYSYGSAGIIGLLQGGPVSIVDDGATKRVLLDLTPDGIDNGTQIGTLAIASASDWEFSFGESVTAEQVQAVIRNLTYQNTDDGLGSVENNSILMNLTDAAGRVVHTSCDIYSIPTGALVLDPDADSAAGTAGDDKFVASPDVFHGNFTLDGGAGTDTLYLADPTLGSFFEATLLAEWTSIERIVYSDQGSSLTLSAQQLAGVNEFVGSPTFGAQLYLAGPDRSTFSFEGKSFSDLYIMPYQYFSTFVFDNKTGVLGGIESYSGDRVRLIGDTFTAQERADLIANGFIYIWDDNDNGAGNAAPATSNLSGDVVRVANGQAIALDLGANASIADDERVRKIKVSVINGGATDKVGISTAGSIRLLPGLVETAGISDGGSASSSDVFAYLYDVTGTSFEILFDGDATQARIDALVRALTYTYDGTAESWQRRIKIEAFDAADKMTSATVTVTSLTDPPPVNEPPVWRNLDQDGIVATTGVAVFVDRDRDAAIVDSDGGGLERLSVSVVDAVDELDLIGIATSDEVMLSSGMVNGSRVVIKSGNLLFDIGSLAQMTSSGFDVVLDVSATPQLVQAFVRAITYTRMVDSDVTARTIKIGIEDTENPIVEATISVTSTADPALPVAPTSLNLTGASIAELSLAGTVIGTVSATDGDIDDVLRYALVDDAGGRFSLDGDRLIVRNAIALDHEQAATHSVRIRVTDKHGLFQERDFAISVTNVDPEHVIGTRQDDIIKGGSGKDRIFGGAGNDTLFGGGGKDVLRGDAGKDIFVFDSWPAKPKHADKILSYVKKDDSLFFDHRAFTQLGKGSFDKPMKLKKQAFWVGEGAHDASDRMIYNDKTGDLLYDNDGIGGKAAIKVAVLSKGLNLASEIWVV